MRLRRTYLTEDESISGSGKLIKDLDFSHPLRALEVSFRGKRYDHSNANDPNILRDIEKIEVVDGADVLYSTDGYTAGAVQLAATKVRPYMSISCNSISGINHAQLRILFGRSLQDDKYGLDLAKHTNPQLRITYSFSEGSSGGWAENEQQVTVVALVAEDAPAPEGFFMTKSLYEFSKATSGDETIDLARDYPYRFLILHSLDVASPVWNEFTRAKISGDYDQFVPIDRAVEDIAWENIARYGMQYIQSEAIGDGSDEDIKGYYPLAWNWGAWVNSWNYGQDAVVKRPYSHYSTLGRRVCPDSSGADFNMTFLANAQRAIVSGFGSELFDSEPIVFGNLDDPGEWLDPKEFKSLRLILTQGGVSTTTSKIIAQQVRKY